MRMDPRLVPVLARFAQSPDSSEGEPISSLTEQRAAEVIQAQAMVGTLTKAVPESVEWVDTFTDGVRPVAVRVYTPAPDGTGGQRTALVYAHGGAWKTGSPDTTHEHTGNLAADAGVIVINVDYRLIPEHPYPAGLDDVSEALRWTRANAQTLGIDPARIAIGGSSAGGNLAASVALKSRDQGGPPIALQLLEAAALELATDAPSWAEGWRDLPPLAAMLDRGLAEYRAAGADAADPYASPLRASSFEDLPPAVILVGEADPLRSDSVRYTEALGAAGVPVSLTIFPGIVHGTEGLVELLPTARDWNAHCVAALRSLSRDGAQEGSDDV